jgi:hypothetical protein
MSSMRVAFSVPERSRSRRVLCILWPAFLMAGVLEMLTFAVVDPRGLHWFGAAPIEWSTSAIYSVTFLIYWGVIATSTAITQLLEAPGDGSL